MLAGGGGDGVGEGEGLARMERWARQRMSEGVKLELKKKMLVLVAQAPPATMGVVRDAGMGEAAIGLEPEDPAPARQRLVVEELRQRQRQAARETPSAACVSASLQQRVRIHWAAARHGGLAPSAQLGRGLHGLPSSLQSQLEARDQISFACDCSGTGLGPQRACEAAEL